VQSNDTCRPKCRKSRDPGDALFRKKWNTYLCRRQSSVRFRDSEWNNKGAFSRNRTFILWSSPLQSSIALLFFFTHVQNALILIHSRCRTANFIFVSHTNTFMRDQKSSSVGLHYRLLSTTFCEYHARGVLSRWRKVSCASFGWSFHIRGSTTVVSLTGGNARRLVSYEQNEQIGDQTSQRNRPSWSWVDQGIAARVPARLAHQLEQQFCTAVAPARAA